MLLMLGDGSVVSGLVGLLSEGFVVLVGYYMFLGLELGLMVMGILSGIGVYVWGLVYFFMFDGGIEWFMFDLVYFDLYCVMGVVLVMGVNFYSFFVDKEFVLLYLGGVWEVFYSKVVVVVVVW